MATTYTFLSDEWFDTVEKLVADNPMDMEGELVVNYTVTGTPFGDRKFYSSSTDGKGGFGRGHKDDAEVRLSLDYETARSIFTSGDPNAGIQAFMAGKVQVEGDVSKLLATKVAAGGEAAAADLGQRIVELTE